MSQHSQGRPPFAANQRFKDTPMSSVRGVNSHLSQTSREARHEEAAVEKKVEASLHEDEMAK